MTRGVNPIIRCFSILLLLCTFSAVARADCPLWDNLQKARKAAEDTAAAFHKVVIPAELEQKIEASIAKKLIDNPGMSMKTALREAQDELSAVEKVQLAPWLAARALRDAADDEFAKADRAYTDAVNAKDKALKEAEAAFEAEQKWLDSEKQAIKDIPRDDAYLDRVSKITKRLRAAYEKMRADLASFRDCFPDVRKFLEDKEERLKRIDKVDQEIARRRGKNPGDQQTNTGDQNANAGDTPQVVPGEPPPPGPLGDVYVCDGPIVSRMQGKLTSVTATGFTYEREVENQRCAAGVKIAKSPPLRVRANQRVELVMSAFGDVKAAVDGNWEMNNVVAGQIPSDNGCSNLPNFKASGNPTTATIRFYFGCGQNAYIRMYGGEYDSRDGTRMDIVWKYHEEGEK